MTDLVTSGESTTAGLGDVTTRGRSGWVGRGAALVVLVVALALPLYVGDFWLRLGLFAFAAMVGALGLNLVFGEAGQLSLAHSFFVVIGAFGYAYFTGESGTFGVADLEGLGLPPVVGLVMAVGLAGLAGLLLTPISARLTGLYLGIATLGLVFLADHIANEAEALTGGAYGRTVEPFSALGFTLDDTPGETLFVLGVRFDRLEKLWYLGLAFVVIGYLYYRNLKRSRPGLALNAIRDGEIAAAVMGVNVTRYKALAFMVSSMYAGLSGVMLALIYQRPVVDNFGLILTIEVLAMVVIGGLGSANGAVIGALFVSSLEEVINHYSDALPVAEPGSGGVTAGVASTFIYGGMIIALLLFEPGGLAALGRRISRAFAQSRSGDGEADVRHARAGPAPPEDQPRPEPAGLP